MMLWQLALIECYSALPSAVQISIINATWKSLDVILYPSGYQKRPVKLAPDQMPVKKKSGKTGIRTQVSRVESESANRSATALLSIYKAIDIVTLLLYTI